MTDPIADYLTRVRNAYLAKHKIVEIPASKMKMEITRILHEKGYTILVVSHEAEKFLAHTDMLYVMEKGRIAEAGPSSVLYNRLPSFDVYLPREAVFRELSWLNA